MLWNGTNSFQQFQKCRQESDAELTELQKKMAELEAKIEEADKVMEENQVMVDKLEKERDDVSNWRFKQSLGHANVFLFFLLLNFVTSFKFKDLPLFFCSFNNWDLASCTFKFFDG